MHGDRDENQARFAALREMLGLATAGVKVAVCVPFPYLAQAEEGLQGSAVLWGGQDVSAQPHGAFTGEVSAKMIADFGCRYAVVGHSERRAYHSERSDQIAMKVRRALEKAITPILCVGETLEERESGESQEIVAQQMRDVLSILTQGEARRLVIAYEPVWAIGTGKSASPCEAQEVHRYIRANLEQHDPELGSVPLLYGGSVKGANASELFREHDIDGALVGGASLDVSEFTQIVSAASKAALLAS